MRSGVGFVFLLVLLGLGLVACQPTCDQAFVSPQNSSPPHMSITDSVRPVLTWDYPEGYCDPPEFVINLFTNSTNGTIAPAGFGGPTGSSEPSWTPPVDLAPGMAYLWSVASKNATLIGPYSNEWQFYVGPPCDSAALVAPVRQAPGDDDVVASLTPRFEWSYPDGSCMPEGYHLTLYDAPDLSSWVIDANNPTMHHFDFEAGVPIDDCMTYSWHVAAVSEGVEGPYSDVGTFSVNAAGACPCEPSGLVQPVPVWPGPYEIVPDLLPVLEWSFPGTCEVGGYAVHLSTLFDMSDTSLFGGTGSPSTSWAPGVSLEHATQYWWQVAAGEGTDFGPYSQKRSFFTGPECSSFAGLPAPELIFPEDGEYITELTAWLHYKPGEPGCIPDGYLLDLQTDPSFGGTNLLTEYNFPATNVLTDPLDDCTTYYWRVAAVQDGSYSPYSETRWFRTNASGTCVFPFYPAFVLENVNCRLCGATNCMIRYIFEKGTMADVLGRSVDGFFFKLRNPNGGECYSPSDSFELPVDLALVEMVRMPPTPTLVPTPTATPLVCTIYLKEKQCEAAGGKWDLVRACVSARSDEPSEATGAALLWQPGLV